MSKTKKAKTRTFNDAWQLEYLVIKNDQSLPQCIICEYTFPEARGYNIRRHYSCKHSSTCSSWTRNERLEAMAKFKHAIQNHQAVSLLSSNSRASLEASYAVSLEIAKEKKPFNDGKIIKKCAVAMASSFKNDEMVKNFNSVSLSPRTVARRITDLASHVREKLKLLFQNCRYFSLCLDESTDITDVSQLLIFTRIVDDDFTVHEELLDLVPLLGTTKGSDIFAAFKSAVDSFGTALLDKCSCIVTDGAPAMMGNKNGFVGHLRQNDMNCPNLHCIIHQEALCSKSLKMMKSMKLVTKVTNMVRGGNRSLTHRKLRSFLEEVDAEFRDLALHCEVRWLSAGHCLERFFAVRKDLPNFLKSSVSGDTSDLEEELKNVAFLRELAFLTDMTVCLNVLNLQLQGKKQSIIDLYTNVNAYREQLRLFTKQLERNVLTHFPKCQEVANEIPDADFSEFSNVLEEITKQFDRRFRDFENLKSDIGLFTNPLCVEIDQQSDNLQLELCRLRIDPKHNSGHPLLYGEHFFKTLSEQFYPKLYDFGLKMTSMFGSTYICESTFSTMKLLKSETRSRMTNATLCNQMRLATTEIPVDVQSIVEKKFNKDKVSRCISDTESGGESEEEREKEGENRNDGTGPLEH